MNSGPVPPDPPIRTLGFQIWGPGWNGPEFIHLPPKLPQGVTDLAESGEVFGGPARGVLRFFVAEAGGFR
jgi:hypothetical protein